MGSAQGEIASGFKQLAGSQLFPYALDGLPLPVRGFGARPPAIIALGYGRGGIKYYLFGLRFSAPCFIAESKHCVDAGEIFSDSGRI